MKLRYFDYNATTPLAPAARTAWLQAQEAHWFNPSSPYRQAAAVRVRYEAARESLAALLGLKDSAERVVFTSGATEANNMVLQHWARQLPSDARLGVNPTEHPSVMEAATAAFGERVCLLALLPDGRVDLEALDAQLQTGGLAALSVMAANNETGVIQPWHVIAQLCQRAQVPYHCDASQWLGKMPLSGLADCSYVSGCAHKFGGPKGVGFVLLPQAAQDCKLLYGGAQEDGQRAGTEDVAGVLAMLAALEASTPCAKSELRDTFIEKVCNGIPNARVVGAEADRLWNTVSLIMPQFQSVRWIRLLEKEGFLVSAGSACATGKSTGSPVLRALGVESAAAGRVLRISSGAETTAEDWDALAEAICRSYVRMRSEASASSSQVITID